MAKYDVEDLLDSVLDIMMGGGALNAKIASIDAEKIAAGKGLTPALTPIADEAYYLQTWTDKILNTSPAIFYGVEDVTALDGGTDAVAKTYKIFVEIILVDSGMTNDSSKRINRYARALEELFSQAYAPALGSLVKIDTVRPISFKLEMDSDSEVKVGGISLTISLV